MRVPVAVDDCQQTSSWASWGVGEAVRNLGCVCVTGSKTRVEFVFWRGKGSKATTQETLGFRGWLRPVVCVCVFYCAGVRARTQGQLLDGLCVSGGITVPQGVCMLVCAKESVPAAGQRLQLHMPACGTARIWGQLSWADQASKPSSWQFSPTPVNICIHTGRHWWCFCLCGHWLLCRSAQTRVCLPECLLFVRGLTGNTGLALLLVEHTGMESQQPCFHQATKFSNPLTSCSNSRTCTANMAFLCYHRLQLDVMLNQEKNSLQTRVRCYVSPIFAQAERWKMLQEKLFSFWIILH